MIHFEAYSFHSSFASELAFLFAAGQIQCPLCLDEPSHPMFLVDDYFLRSIILFEGTHC
jgi:hypothetical protein